MFRLGQLVQQKAENNTTKYGYVLGKHKTKPGIWRVMMTREGTDTLFYEEVLGEHLRTMEEKKC